MNTLSILHYLPGCHIDHLNWGNSYPFFSLSWKSILTLKHNFGLLCLLRFFNFIVTCFQNPLNVHQPVLSLKKYLSVVLSRMQIYKITLCPRNKFSYLTKAQSLKKQVYLWRTCHNIYKRPNMVQTTIQYTQRVWNLWLHFVD